MTDDYLWDRSGKPDPEVQRLETQLGRLRHEGAVPDFALPPLPLPRPWWREHAPRVLAAAAVVLVAAGLWAVLGPRPQAAWSVAPLAGTPRAGGSAMREPGRLDVGEWLETGPDARAKLVMASVGEVEVGPGTRLRLLRAERSQHRLALRRGRLAATIWARPRLFFIETPSATAVDLGCAYTLEVDEAGAGMIHVTAGWVAFELDGRESVIPTGAWCATRPGRGPGTPYFPDAAPELVAALARLDFGALSPPERDAALGELLRAARPRDAVSLWHLLTRGAPEERRRAAERLAELVPAPAGVTLEGVLAGDRGMLDRWWNALGLGEATWWRMWKAQPPRPRG